MKKIVFTSWILIMNIITASNAVANTVAFNMGVLLNTDDFEFPSLSPTYSGSIYPGLIYLDGLSQFDSSFGTLNKVSFTIEGDLTYSLSTDVPFFNEVIDETLPNEISMTAELGVLLGKGFFGFFSDNIASVEVACSSGAFQGACSDNVNGVSSTLSSRELTSSSFGSLDQFIGNGVLGEYQLKLFASNDIGGIATNLENDAVLIGMNFTGQVSVEYDFTPTVVPIPASVWLFGSSLIGLFGMRKKLSVLPHT